MTVKVLGILLGACIGFSFYSDTALPKVKPDDRTKHLSVQLLKEELDSSTVHLVVEAELGEFFFLNDPEKNCTVDCGKE